MSIERHRNSRKSTEMRQNKHTEIYPKSHILQNSADFTETCIFSRKTNNITERVAVVKFVNYEYVILLACRIRHREALKHPEHWGSGCIATPVGSCATTLAITLARCSILWRQSVASSSAICGVLWHRVATTRQYCATAFNAHTHTHTGRKRRDSMYRVTRLSSGRGCCCCCCCRIKLANHSYSRSLAPSMSFWQCFIYQQVVYRNDKIKILILN